MIRIFETKQTISGDNTGKGNDEEKQEKTLTLLNFVLETGHTSYLFRTTETGQLEHLYYGKKIHVDETSHLEESHTNAHGNSILYQNDHPELSLEDLSMETSAYGKGDIREPQFGILAADGSSTLDLVYLSHEILDHKEPFRTLPSSYGDPADGGKVDHLLLSLRDRNAGYIVELHYYVYEDCDVISRSAKFINASGTEVTLTRALSNLLDFPASGYRITSFHGGWTKEMGKYETILTAGKFVNSSFTGTSSNRSNPLVLMAEPLADEDRGRVYGFNLIYSGNHYEAFDVNSFGKTRFVSGINPDHFSWHLNPGEEFETPEAVMTFSDQGYNGMSQNMHHFVRRHISRGVWKNKERPVLLNSWEANYFDIDEGKLLKLAKKGKEAGVELFVMDDGWFGQRSDDHRALGDWQVNTRKLPGGLKGLSDKIHKLGLKFGIWIEPEMVNVDSDLYRAHPDWSMDIPGKDHAEGRNQRLLDFANPAVVDYITKAISAVLQSAEIDYVKWDMNRIVSDIYSKYLPADRQGETLHRYMLGVYQLMKNLTEAFPDILWEGCASGGCRFDLGALCFFSQIWASDNTDAVSRMDIQNGYSYGYPQITYTSHVSAVPNHQTLRVTPMETRANVAFFGNLGYECNLCDMSKEDCQAIAVQISIYKKYRKTLQFGDFYRTSESLAAGNRASDLGRALGLMSPAGGEGQSDNIITWTIVSPDRKQAVAMVAEKEIHPSDPHLTYVARGLDPDKKYHFSNLPIQVNVKTFGDLVNTVGLPIHVKQDSLVHNLIARFYHLDGEKEDSYAYGDSLIEYGKPLTQAYIGSGINNVRVFKDASSRLYFLEEVEQEIETQEDPAKEKQEDPANEA